MALTVDDVMDKIGSFARYQYRMLFIFGFMKIFGDGFQIMIPTFLSIEPAWRCRDNSSACNLTGVFKPGDKHYNFRCSIPRDEWVFDTSEIISSVVTEVKWIGYFSFSCKAWFTCDRLLESVSDIDHVIAKIEQCCQYLSWSPFLVFFFEWKRLHTGDF